MVSAFANGIYYLRDPFWESSSTLPPISCAWVSITLYSEISRQFCDALLRVEDSNAEPHDIICSRRLYYDQGCQALKLQRVYYLFELRLQTSVRRRRRNINILLRRVSVCLCDKNAGFCGVLGWVRAGFHVLGLDASRIIKIGQIAQTPLDSRHIIILTFKTGQKHP